MSKNKSISKSKPIRSFQISPPPDKDHNYQVLLIGLGAFFISIIAGGVGFLLASQIS